MNIRQYIIFLGLGLIVLEFFVHFFNGDSTELAAVGGAYGIGLLIVMLSTPKAKEVPKAPTSDVPSVPQNHFDSPPLEFSSSQRRFAKMYPQMEPEPETRPYQAPSPPAQPETNQQMIDVEGHFTAQVAVGALKNFKPTDVKIKAKQVEDAVLQESEGVSLFTDNSQIEEPAMGQ